MPGLVTAVSVEAGDGVERGSPLLSIEAMKMQTSVAAEQAGQIEKVLVAEGQQIELGDLLIVYA